MCRAVAIFLMLLSPVFVVAGEAPAASTYRHVSGLEFSYPADWTVREPDYADVELVPAGRAANETGITEAYFLWGIGAAYSDPADAKLLNILESLVRQMVPFLERTGEAETLQSGKVGLLRWSGKSADGASVVAQVYAAAVENTTWVLAGIGLQQQVLARRNEMESIVSTFHNGDFVRDFALIGKWVTPAPQSQPAEGNGASLDVRMDGSFQFLDPSAGSDAADAMNGTWYAADGLLYFVLPGGMNAHLRYELDGNRGSRTLTLAHAAGGVQVLVESSQTDKPE